MAEFVGGIRVTSAESRKLLTEARTIALAANTPTDNIVLCDLKTGLGIKAARLRIEALLTEIHSRRN